MDKSKEIDLELSLKEKIELMEKEIEEFELKNFQNEIERFNEIIDKGVEYANTIDITRSINVFINHFLEYKKNIILN